MARIKKEKGFVELQASVYVAPYPLSRGAIAYLKQSGLIAYVRIALIYEFDDDKKLLDHFKLAKRKPIQISSRR